MTGALVKEIIAFAVLIGATGLLAAMGGKKSRSMAAADAAGGAKTGWPADAVFGLKAALVLGIFMIPAFFHSDSPYSFYTMKDASVKVAFKHSGRKVVSCDEADVIKSEGERYRKGLKETSRVQMNMARFAGCPRERFPVYVTLTIDGKKVLDRSYAPTGLKKDMASYIYDEFIVEPGRHKLSAALSESGKKDAPDYVFEDTVDLKPSAVKLLLFDDTLGKLVVE